MSKLRAALFLTSLILVVEVVRAGECGNGLPCGSIPWPQPNPPPLVSPSPMPTIGVTVNPPTATPGGPTATPAPTDVSFDIDVSGINDQFATLQNLAEATEPVILVSGTPVNSGTQLQAVATNSYQFFGYVRGVSELDLGGLTPFLLFIFTSFVVVVSVKSLTFILPVLIALFNFIRGIVSLVLDFLPF